MAITSIMRDWGTDPAIVRIQTTDTLAAASAEGYITAQSSNIQLVNNGEFEWLTSDMVAVTASDGNALFNISSDFSTLVMQAEGIVKTLTITLAQFLAGYTTPVPLVAAPGAGNLLVFKQMQLLQTYGSAPLADGGVSAVQYDSTVHGAGVIASTTHAAANFQVSASSTYTYNAGVVVLPFATTVNKGLYLSNLTGNFTAGTASTFEAKIWYNIVTVS